tara:strand:+ start:19283 stop:19726 length:444 start_codon:yes stop_codon:yes gene_type:complete
MLDKARIRRPKTYESLMTKLCKGDHAVFDTYADLLIFAAVLGQNRGESASFSQSAEPVALTIFGGQFDKTVMNTLAVAACDNDPDIMSDQNVEAKIKIFEEYANGGLNILDTNLKNVPDDDIQATMVNLILRTVKKNKILGDITGLA